VQCSANTAHDMGYHTNHRVYLKLHTIIGLVMAWSVIMLKVCIRS